MDALDRLAGPARDLLAKVDDSLARTGAPADHPLWPLLRHLRVLPGDAVGAVAGLDPASVDAMGPPLRTLSDRYSQSSTPPLDWHGPAAQAFNDHWRTLSAFVEQGLSGRLADTASFAEAVAAWMRRTRMSVARMLATGGHGRVWR